jgi:hypothetical protein
MYAYINVPVGCKLVLGRPLRCLSACTRLKVRADRVGGLIELDGNVQQLDYGQRVGCCEEADEQVEFEVGRVDVDVERMKVGYQAIEDLRGGEWGIDRDVELERARIHDDSFGLTREALASMSPISTTPSRCELMQA